MKRTRFLTLLLSLVLCVLMSFGIFAQEESFNIDLNSVNNMRNIVGEKSQSEIKMTSINGFTEKRESPALFFNGFSVDTTVYRYLVMEMQTDITLTKDGHPAHAIYFRTDKQTGFSESKKVTVNLQTKSDGYVTYIFDMATKENWEGTCTGIFYSFSGDVHGTASIKSMKFLKGDAIKRIELTEEEKLKDLPQPERVVHVSDFAKNKQYTDMFGDVKVKDWFYESVSSAYEYGFVNGSSDTTYSPNGTMTVAEAVTLASRMHSAQNKDGKAEKIGGTNPWYQGYVDYAKAEGFLKDGDFDSYTRPIKRYEMVSLFAKSLPSDVFHTLNYVTHIPDVSKDKAYADAVYMFYNAGICMGSDIYGTFNPDSNIKRSEVAAIVSRIADYNLRLDQDLAVKANSDAAYWVIDDSANNARNTISMSTQSGWDYDIRGSMPKEDDEPPYNLADISSTEPVTLTRTLTVQDSGIITTAPTSLRFNSGLNGWYMQTVSSDDFIVYKLFTKNDKFYILDGGKEVDTGIKAEIGPTYYVKIITDIDKKTNTYVINNKPVGPYGFANAGAVNMQTFMIGTTDEAVINCSMGTLRMHANYRVNEYLQSSNYIPYDWKAESTGDSKVSVASGEFVFTGNEGKASLTKSFTPASGKVAARLIMLYPEPEDGFGFALTSGGKNVITFTTKNGKMYAGATELREYSDMMWYMVRIVADTKTQTAQIKVSGKTIAENIPFETKADSIDGIVLLGENLGGKKVRVDDVTVEVIPQYDNYPSEPKVPEGADDYYIGINICNLWRNGYHWGWDNISPYDENKPYLGWYDEGLPEVADWEIKYFAEHGIDFQLVCWYHSAENPMKTFYGSTPQAVFNGFMNAEYSDKYGKFALLWEASNGQRPKNLDDFKTRFCDFWFEYFFSDPRYMVIDNKLVMSIFGATELTSSFGNAQGVKEAFEYLDERVRTELGYDGIIIMACASSSDSNTLTNLANMGIDAVHAYNWGNSGYLATTNQTNIANQQRNGQNIIHNVPTISTGFNNIAWAYTRHPQLTTDNMEQVLLWVRDKALGKYELKGNGDDWKKNFIMLSTWNEYGEGTYMMPSGLNGFGYLDTVRKVFTKGGEHTDVRPDNIQMGRLGHLYPINREIIRPEGYYQKPEYTTVLFEESFTSGWRPNGSITFNVENGLLVGTSNSSDPIMHGPMTHGPINAAEVKAIRVWVDSPVGDKVEVYFQTEDDKTWTGSKGASATVTKEGLNPVTIEIGNNAKWQGKITALRIDPLTSARSFKAQKVEFLGEKQTEKLLINNREYFCDIANVKTENDILIPFYPDTGIGYRLGCKYTWDKVGKKLTLVKNGVEMVFTMGSDRIVVNGEPVKFETEIYLEDGIPMVPIHFICDKFGYKTENYDDNGVKVFSIITVSNEHYDIISTRKDNQWEFNLTGDMEGFALQSCSANVENGALCGVATTSGSKYDPAVRTPELKINSNQYSTIKVRMKHSIDVEKTDANKGEFTLTIYFASSAGGLAESRTFKTPIEQSSNGEFLEYTFNVKSNQGWTGTISQIRVDPFNNVPGTFEIDYIRFE